MPLYAFPAAAQQAQRQGRPWFTRQQLDTLPDARAALAGQEIAWLADPIDALMLQIQGSGRLRVTEADGSVRLFMGSHFSISCRQLSNNRLLFRFLLLCGSRISVLLLFFLLTPI